jgi:hypothetical protein
MAWARGVKQHIVRIALGLAVLALFLGHAGKFYQLEVVTRLDHLLYGTRLRLTAPGTVGDRIVILDIDERSLATPELGRWPWGRDVVAGIVRKLFDKYGAALVAFDVVNDEPVSRIEGLTKQYGAAIIAGQATKEAVGGVVFGELDRVRVKGKDEPVAIFEAMCRDGEVAKERLEELKLRGEALQLYRTRNWDQAELILFNLQRLYPGAQLYSLYADRVARYRQDPPGAGWVGVSAFEAK